VQNLDADIFEKAYEMAHHLKYQNLLDGMQAAGYPQMSDKGNARSKFHKKIYNLAYPEMFRKQRAIKSDEIKLV